MLCLSKTSNSTTKNTTFVYMSTTTIRKSFYNKLKNIYIDIYTHITMYTLVLAWVACLRG